jgi:hypothetical protein
MNCLNGWRTFGLGVTLLSVVAFAPQSLTAHGRGGGGGGSGGGGGGGGGHNHGGGGGGGWGGGHNHGGGGGWGGGGGHNHGGGWGGNWGGGWNSGGWNNWNYSHNNWGYSNSYYSGYTFPYTCSSTVSYYDAAPLPLWDGPVVNSVGGYPGGQTFLDTAASYLYWQTNDATWDMYHNYTGAPGYRSTYREMYKLLQTVKVISAAIRDEEVGAVGPNFPFAIRQDLLEAHGMLQAMRLDVSQWNLPGNAAAGAAAMAMDQKLVRMSATLTEIMQFVGVPPTPTNFAPQVTPNAFAPAAPSATQPIPEPTPVQPQQPTSNLPPSV